jgi:hypothetical protein
MSQHLIELNHPPILSRIVMNYRKTYTSIQMRAIVDQ